MRRPSKGLPGMGRSLALGATFATSVAALALSGCNLLVDFDPEGQPCNEDGVCLPGFACVSNVCRPTEDACGGCPSGERCLEQSATCVADTCAARDCPAGERCVEDAVGSYCEPPPAAGLGARCDSDVACGDGLVCLISASRRALDNSPHGFCASPCEGDECPSGVSGSCVTVEPGLGVEPVSVCLPTDSAVSCQVASGCPSAESTCTLFEHPEIGALGLCDTPIEGDAVPGDGCSDGAECESGLCLPRDSEGYAPACAELCSSSCGGSDICTLVEVSVGGDAPVRVIPACVPIETRCNSCAGGAGICGRDAPRCSSYAGGSYCLSECTQGVTGSTCPPDHTCTTLPEGDRCVPTGGC